MLIINGLFLSKLIRIYNLFPSRSVLSFRADVFFFCYSLLLVFIIHPFPSVCISSSVCLLPPPPSFACSPLRLPLRVGVVACPFACPAFPVLLHRIIPSSPPLLHRCSHPDRGCQTARRSQAVCPRRWSLCYHGDVPASRHSLPVLYVSVSG